jgi:hypothetical protein
MRLIPESPDRSWYARLILLAGLAILLAGLPVPIPVRALIEVSVMGAAAVVTVLGLARHSRMQVARIAFLLMLVLYVALLSKPNIPDLSSGLQGIRYTMVDQRTDVGASASRSGGGAVRTARGRFRAAAGRGHGIAGGPCAGARL